MSDFEGDDVEIWPENWPVFILFGRLRTQWREGFNGKTGLDYSAVYPLLDREFKDEWALAFSDIQAMESEALTAMTKG